MYCLKFMSKNYTCKYYHIGRCGDYLHVTQYGGVETIYMCIYIYSTENLLCCTSFSTCKTFQVKL